MIRFLVCFVFLLSHCMLFSQFVDDFSNGNFTEDPPWVGDRDKFIVDDGVLRLYDEEAGLAWLSTQSQVVANTQWDFWLRIGFTPSDNNHPRIYLVSNQSDLSGPLNGYFIQVGKTGGDNKRIFLGRQDGLEETILVTGQMNLAEGSSTTLRIRVFRDGLGNWNVLAAPGGGTLFIPQGQAHDNTYTSSHWFGIRCTYTVSNSTRFYFDDFRVGDILPGAAPEVTRVQVVTPEVLDVHFNTIVHIPSAQNASNYLVDGGIGHPLIAAVDPDKPYLVRLQFADAFTENHAYTLAVEDVLGADGQGMVPYAGPFAHYVSAMFDVVFNEIMANSRPEVGLPPHDWVELYNTTHLPIDVEGWVLQHGDTERALPHATIPPEGYLVLCTEAAYPELEGYGLVLAVPGLSATAFTIGGSSLALWDNAGSLLAFVEYNDSWYRDASKAQGGWSLEKIDPHNHGQGAENWKASSDPRGGTPGTTNAQRAENPNTAAPRLVRAGYVDSLTVRLHFSEPMQKTALLQHEHYHIPDGPGTPSAVSVNLPDLDRVELSLEQPLEAGKTYTVEVVGALIDCDGNSLQQNQVRVAIPDNPVHNGIVINEILFNPPSGGSRYIEIYNRSERVFDLQHMILAAKDPLDDSLTSLQEISGESLLFFPGDYLVLSQDTGAIRQTYPLPVQDVLWEMAGMPRMTNTSGVVVVATKGHAIIDLLAYEEDMHLPLIANPSGVALERLHPDRPSGEASSWHSAAATAGYGTPGYQNSQYVPPHTAPAGHWEVYPQVFSPDGTGHHDVLQVLYKLETPGYVAHIRVFDRSGRKVRTLSPGKLLATEGVITWDGTTDDGEKASVGVYVIHVEMVHDQGRVQTERLWAVLGGRL